MALKLTSSRLKPIKKRGAHRYISASALVKRHEVRPLPSVIPALASVQLAQLIREIGLAEKGARISKLNNQGRSVNDFAEAAVPGIQRISDILSRYQQSEVSEDVLAMLPKKAGQLFFSKGQALQLGQAISTLIHITLWDAFTDGLREGGKKAPKNWRADWRRQHTQYQGTLKRLREAALQQDLTLCASCLRNLSVRALVELPKICKEAGKASAYARKESHTSSSHFGLQISNLSRKTAMLAGAAALLCQRLSSSRSSEATRQIAERRTTLMREGMDLRQMDLVLDDLAHGQLINVAGRVKEVVWEERPKKPVSIIRLEQGQCELLVPYKSMRRQGLAAGSYCWCLGKVKRPASSKPYIEVEQEGPNQHAGEVWEDWLATQTRPFYDLYPASVEMVWEFPEQGHFGSMLDFLTRVNQ